MQEKLYYQFHLNDPAKNLLAKAHDLNNSLNKAQKEKEDLAEIIQKKLKIEWTYESNAIEGSTLTHGETLFFIEQGLTVEGKPFKDFLDVKNHIEAIDFVFDIIKSNRVITEGTLKEINALLLFGIKSTPAIAPTGQKVEKTARPGEYKRQPNHVLQADGQIHKYVLPEQVAPQIKNLCDWITEAYQKKIDPILIAAVAHYNFVRIHPFDDGNGRGARILMNIILMKANFPPAIIKNEKRREYYDVLSAGDAGNVLPFICFVVEAIIATQQSILDVLRC